MTVQQLATSPFFAKRQGYDHLLLYGVEFLGPPFASPLTLGGDDSVGANVGSWPYGYSIASMVNHRNNELFQDMHWYIIMKWFTNHIYIIYILFIYYLYMCIIDGLFSYFFIFTNHPRCIHHWVFSQVSALSRSAWLRLDGLPSPGSQLDRAHGAPGATGCSGLLIGSHWFVSLSESRNFQPQQAQQTSKEDFWWFLPIASEGNRGWQVDISPDLLHPEFLTQKRNGFQSWQGMARNFQTFLVNLFLGHGVLIPQAGPSWNAAPIPQPLDGSRSSNRFRDP